MNAVRGRAKRALTPREIRERRIQWEKEEREAARQARSQVRTKPTDLKVGQIHFEAVRDAGYREPTYTVFRVARDGVRRIEEGVDGWMWPEVIERILRAKGRVTVCKVIRQAIHDEWLADAERQFQLTKTQRILAESK